MSVGELLKVKRENILEVASTYGAKNVRVFGSAARNEARPSSDIDFLVEFEEGRSLLDLVGLGQDLEKLLGRPVDVVEPEGVHRYIRERVLQEAVPL
ncbi:MAG TPA: nucleotidyltransferase family protein [Terriglobia bacterium]|nr:nucleotidyltransferase family protein [Terriglobia bacterium]